MAESAGVNDPDSINRTGSYILVADNDAQSLVFMSMVLQRLQYSVRTAHNADKAIELAQYAPPRLIITDLRLRGMTGLELMHQVGQGPRTQNIPFIITAREFTPGLKEQHRLAGAAGCLKKPVQADELYQLIHPIVEPGSRRRNLRIETQLAVTMDDTPLDAGHGECASMLSVNGMYIRTLRSFRVNTLVGIQVDLHGQIVSADARVIYLDSSNPDHAGMTGIGLQFQNISPHGRELIRRFINDEVTHGLAPGWT